MSEQQRKQSLGIGVVAFLSLGVGSIAAVNNTLELLRRTPFDGTPLGITEGVLGIASVLLSLVLVIGGMGTWLIKAYGRTFSLIAAVGELAVMVVAVVVLSMPLSYLIVGAVYPVILFVVFNLPRWRAVFSHMDTAPVSGAG